MSDEAVVLCVALLQLKATRLIRLKSFLVGGLVERANVENEGEDERRAF